MNILIVDDEEDLRETLKDLIELETGYNVQTAADGVEALEVTKSTSFNFMIVDFRMPNMNGVEFIENFSNTVPESENTKILLLSGFLQEALPHLKRFPHIETKSKPINPSEIINCINEALKKSA